MNNVSYQKRCLTVAVKFHVDQPLIPLIKIKNYMKAEKYCVNIKVYRDPTPEK